MSISNIGKKRLLKDVANIMKHPLTENGIYYVHDENDMNKGYALIIGPSETPYKNGFYLFELHFPQDYPFSPPKVLYRTNDGKTRFNPNLYRNGKVCVSILNTWSGEQWTSCQTIRSVLMTLLTLFNSNPLINEPGFDSSAKYYKYCCDYRDSIQFMNYKIAICSMLQTKLLPEIFYGFLPIMQKHALNKSEEIMKDLVELKKSSVNKKTLFVRVYNMYTTIDYESVINDFDIIIKDLN